MPEHSSRVPVVVIALGAGALAFATACAVDPAPDDPAPEDSAAVQPVTQRAAILVSPRVSAISEAGDPAFFQVSLSARPRGPVTLVIAPSDPSEARVTPTRLRFTPHTWRTPQTLKVTAVDDADFDGDIATQVRFAPALSHDPAYAGLRVAPLDVLSVDDDYEVTGYRVRALDGSAIESRAVAINQRGQVVFDMRIDEGVIHPFLWDRGQITDLGSLGGPGHQSHALDLNDAGVVLGWSDTLDGVRRFVSQDGALVASPGETWAINDRGHTVGDALYADGQQIEIPDLGDQPAMGLALNHRDHVTGFAPTPPFHQHAFFWADGQFVDLGTAGGPIAAGLDINEHDQVVGRMFTPQIFNRPFLYQGGQVIDLGSATGTPSGVATAINNRGDIVGSDEDTARMPETGWIGRPGSLRSLKTLLVDGTCFFLLEAIDINDSGHIIVNGSECSAGRFRAYLLEPLKVPAAAP
jgi:probable HAF family extracellular repeat protein